MSTEVYVLSFCERQPPLAILAAAKLRNVNLELKKEKKQCTPEIAIPSGETFPGTIALKYIAASGEGTCNLGVSAEPLTTAVVEQWLEYTQYLSKQYDVDEICKKINNYLSLRSYFVGSELTLADLAIWEQITNIHQDLSAYAHLSRWCKLITANPSIQSIDTEWNKKKGGKKNTKNNPSGIWHPSLRIFDLISLTFVDKNAFEIDLPNAVIGSVVTRFPPEPSGYLHIGHAKAALLNFHVAQMYKGKMIVRFDDTNPSKEKDEFVDNILQDLEDLGVKSDRLTYTSDYFEQLQDMGTALIKNGVVYADNTPVEVMRQERMDGIESKCRDKSTEDSLNAWEEMKKGSEVGFTFCMRIKLDMKAANKALRDPVIFRCNKKSHWRTGAKYKVYPTYDFACPYVDAVEGVTHAMRTSEYKDREAQYMLILKEMQKIDASLPNVQVWEYARLNFVYTVLSKRKLQWFVDNDKVEGWNDPRFPTVQGMLRRGLTLDALKEFVLSQGASKNITFQEWDKIWTINKKIIDPVVPRHTAVETSKKVKIKLSGLDEVERVTVPKHKKYAKAGTKVVVRDSEIWIDWADAEVISEEEEITLMDWGNCIIKKKQLEDSEIEGELNLDGDFKKTKWKLTWLSATTEVIPLELVYFDYLITKKKLDEEDDFHEFVNSETKKIINAVGDFNMTSLSKGDIIQLERKGYFRVDEPYSKESVPMILFNIPDGKQKK
eukprot:g8691.t1